MTIRVWLLCNVQIFNSVSKIRGSSAINGLMIHSWIQKTVDKTKDRFEFKHLYIDHKSDVLPPAELGSNSSQLSTGAVGEIRRTSLPHSELQCTCVSNKICAKASQAWKQNRAVHWEKPSALIFVSSVKMPPSLDKTATTAECGCDFLYFFVVLLWGFLKAACRSCFLP